MQRGIAVALIALASFLAGSAALAADGADNDRHRLYDRQTDCAVYDTAGFPADRATWDGPCTHGLAGGRGTATYYGRDGASQTLSAEFEGGMPVDGKAEISWSDGAHYTGTAADGRPDGTGTLVDAKANRFDGAWKNGALDGRGAVAWSNGDRYEGDWVAGKAEGHGVQVWADGQKYDGAWHNDQPNGQGTLTRKDGTVLAGLFVDGKHQPLVPPSAAAAPTSIAAVAPPPAPLSPGQGLDAFAGRTLFGVDGSSIAFAARDGGLVRTMTAPDGSVQKSAFTFLGKGLGTISDAGDPPQVSGVFRLTPSGLAADYSDGHSETLAPVADGLAITLRSPAGDTACAAWYPQGHVFSADERKAAVAAYARRLGLSDAGAAPRTSCGGQTAAPVADHHPVALPAPPKKHPARAAMPAAFIAPADLQDVPVRTSTVHLIDPGDAIVTATAGAAASDEPIASNCLKVDSDGSYWGFRNHCGYAVQFAYCLLRGTNAMTACGGAVSVPGSVPANGFGALFADDSLGERDVEHDFRWIGCKGGAGEVAAHLDAAEPASGRCVRAGRTLAREN